MNRVSTLDKLFKLSLTMLAFTVLTWLFLKVGHYFFQIMVLLGLALIVTYLLLAPVNVVEAALRWFGGKLSRGRKWPSWTNRIPKSTPRTVSILLVYLIFFLITVIMSLRFTPVALRQLNEFSSQVPRYVHVGEDWLLSLPVTQSYFHQEVKLLEAQEQGIPVDQGKLIAPAAQGLSGVEAPKLSVYEKNVIRERVFSTSNRFNTFLKQHLGRAFSDLLHLFGKTLEGLIYTLTGLVLVFYFLLDGPKLKTGFIEMLPSDVQQPADYFLSSLHNVMFGFIKGQVILGIVTGAYLILISTALGVPYAMFLGTFFAIAQLVPVVGAWIGFLPWIFVLQSLTPATFFSIVALIALFQLIKDVWIAPKIMGHVMGLHPVIVILSLLVCAKAMGLLGFLFAIPLASMVNVSIQFFQHHWGEEPA